MRRLLFVLGTLGATSPGLLAQTRSAMQPAARSIDWTSLQTEAVQVLSGYLKINTTNPPGNELAGALYLKRILEKEGIQVQLLDSAQLGKGRVNLYARLKGNGTKKAIALVQHIDVVPSDPKYWSVDPFSGVVKDGFVWGRGALDMKGEGIMHLMAVIALKRSGVPLTRDIVLIANADEELGSTGAQTFVNRHPDLLKDVEFLVTEGGDNPVRDGKLEYYGVGVAEKRTFWQKVVIKGVPSHGSRPTKQNPVPKLIDALNRIAQYETAVHLTPGVEKYFRDIARNYTGQQRDWLTNVRTSLNNKAARDWILNDVYWNAILRNTISLTVLSGSNKTNVIPAEASAEIDVRLLPDQDPAVVLAELKKVANHPEMEWTGLLAPKAPLESPIDTDLFRAIERAARERDPNALVTTPMLTGATDRPVYRALGITTYGLNTFKVDRAETQRGVHGNNERISVENVHFGVRFMYDILRYVQ